MTKVLPVSRYALGPVRHQSKARVLAILSDGRPRSLRQIIKETGLSTRSVEAALRRLHRLQSILRSKEQYRKQDRQLKGRRGLVQNLRKFHLYVLHPVNINSLTLNGIEFRRHHEETRGCRPSKARRIREFLEQNCGKAYFSTEIVQSLKVNPTDIMPNIHRFEKQGLVFVRGYREADRETPFTKGYLLTWVDCTLGRDAGIRKAIEVTSHRLIDEENRNPVVHRIRMIRDLIVAAAVHKEILSKDFLREKLGCTESELDRAILRTMQLYSDIVEIKLFDAYVHFYLTTIPDADLSASIQLRENYIRKTKGAANRTGHNFEATIGWFIERTAAGAKFWTQQHRGRGMHPRRITTHLIRSVGDRRMNAELDRVWEVSPGPLQPPITFVLECKSSLVTKRTLDEFQNILRFSVDFGVDTPDGRAIRNGVVGVFAGGTFDPRERIRLKDGTNLTLSQYAARCNIQLIRTADLNEKLVQRGVDRQITVQRLCRDCRNEEEVKEVLDAIWDSPENATSILNKTAMKNRGLFELEHKLAMPTTVTGKIEEPAIPPQTPSS